MGNDTSKQSNRMAVSALAHMMRISKPQLLALRDKCLSVSETGKYGYRLSRANFSDAMMETNVTIEPDYHVLDNFFVMWDRDGIGSVNTLEFFAGIAQLASVMDIDTKLQFSLEVYDYKNNGRVSRKDLVTVLEAINTTASYLGDAVLQKKQVAIIVEDLFADERMLDVTYSDKVHRMTNHPLVAEFASGAGTARYGSAQ